MPFLRSYAPLGAYVVPLPTRCPRCLLPSPSLLRSDLLQLRVISQTSLTSSRQSASREASVLVSTRWRRLGEVQLQNARCWRWPSAVAPPWFFVRRRIAGRCPSSQTSPRESRRLRPPRTSSSAREGEHSMRGREGVRAFTRACNPSRDGRRGLFPRSSNWRLRPCKLPTAAFGVLAPACPPSRLPSPHDRSAPLFRSTDSAGQKCLRHRR